MDYDVIVAIGCLATSFAAGITLFIDTMIKRHKKPAQDVIDPAVRAEIDQTPEWWDAQFRKLGGVPADDPYKAERERIKRRHGGLIAVQNGNMTIQYAPEAFVMDVEPPTKAEIEPTNRWNPGFQPKAFSPGGYIPPKPMPGSAGRHEPLEEMLSAVQAELKRAIDRELAFKEQLKLEREANMGEMEPVRTFTGRIVG